MTFQYLMYAEGKRSLLICLQGRDAAGKDGTINHVLGAMNPQGCPVTGFKVPSKEEAAHDFLWRYHKAAPAKGQVAIFNRSHYEDVLVVRVHDLVPKSVWSKRYRHINAFEKMLHDNGTHILKFYLHIDPGEQANSSSGSSSASTTPPVTGRSATATTPSARSGTPTPGHSRTRWASAAPRTRPGSSSPRTTNGSAISPSPGSSPRPWSP